MCRAGGPPGTWLRNTAAQHLIENVIIKERFVRGELTYAEHYIAYIYSM